MKKTLEQRFWEKVNICGCNECWEWKASRHPKGYGSFGYRLISKGRMWVIGAHRVAWELTNGPIPDGLHVLHRCDNPPCCNPAHLFLGTKVDNTMDMVSKGRQRGAVGERNHNSRLSENDVRLIRYLHRSGRNTQRDIAICFAVTVSLIEKVVSRAVWAHVKGDWP